MIYLIDLTWLILLAPGIAIVAWAGHRLANARRLAGRADEPEAPTGAELVAVLLNIEGAEPWEVVADGPPWDAIDPPRRAIRLDPRTAVGRSASALGRAAMGAGRALQVEGGSPWGRFGRPLDFGLRLGRIAAWMTMAAGVVLDYYGLFLAGIVLFDGVVTLGLIAWPAGRDAARRASSALGRVDVMGPDLAGRVGRVLAVEPWRAVAAAGFLG